MLLYAVIGAIVTATLVLTSPSCSGGKKKSLIPHPTECAQFYNCSQETHRWRWPVYLEECTYPQVFNDKTLRCEHFTMVDCGSRKEPLGKCEYRATFCPVSHCIPCSVHNPSCRGYPDGFHPYKGKEGSPFYIICKSQRLVYEGNCRKDFNVHIFDSVKKMCVSAY